MIYQWSIAAIILGIPAYAGACCVAFLRVFQEKIETLAIGSIGGIAVFGTVAYTIAHRIPLTATRIWAILAMFFVVGSILAWRGGWSAFQKTSTDRVALSIVFATLLIFAVIGSKLLIETPAGLYTGIINAYGDIGWHTALITRLSEVKTLPIEDPIFQGTALTYPFLANLLSAIMVSTGASLSASVNVPAIFLIPLLLTLTYVFGKIYGGSRIAGILVVILLLFGGATLGWTRVFQDFTTNKTTILNFLFHLPERDYSGVGGDEAGFNFLNPVTSLLLPQRAMLFGIPIVLAVLILIHPAIMKRRYALMTAGALAGMLPLFHAHACIALAAGIIAAIITNPSKIWLQFIIPALLIGIPELLFYTRGDAPSESFFRFEPWWMKGDRNVISYWIQNTGFLIPISIIALFQKPPKYAMALAIAGTILLILANTFLFAPWAWDNFKILVFWLIFVLPIISWSLSKLWAHEHKIYARPLVVILMFIQTFSGGLDIWKLVIPTARTWQEWDQSGIQFAISVQKNIPVSETIVTAPVHNSPIVLAGRQLFLGYPAHVWSHGILPWTREQEVKNFYAGTSQTIAGEIPKYIVIGPQERYSFPAIYIRPAWKKEITNGQYELFTNES